MKQKASYNLSVKYKIYNERDKKATKTTQTLCIEYRLKGYNPQS